MRHVRLRPAVALAPTTKKRSGVARPASYTFPFLLLLVEENERAYRVRVPVTSCGNPQQSVLDALAAIAWTSNGTFDVVWR